MQVEGRVFQTRMTQQKLDGAMIRPGFQQFRGEGMPKSVRTDLSGNAGAASRLLYRSPDDLVRHRCFHTTMALGTGE